MKLNVKKSMTRGIQHELSDADYKASAQAEIIFGFVDSIRQPGNKVICLNGTDGNVPGDPYVESAACDHGEVSCRAGRAGSDREVRIKPMGGAEKGLRVQRESAAKRIGEARSCGERNERQPAHPVVHAGGGFSGNVGYGAESAIDMKGYLSIAAIHAEAAALAGVGITA
jgi:hypothetical protein